MAVAETFLRDGRPWPTNEALREGYGSRGVAPYPAWHCVVTFVRRWCTDLRAASYMCPGYVLFFGTSGEAGGASPLLLRLFTYVPVHLKAVAPMSSVEVAQFVMRTISDVHRAVPEGCRPAHGTTLDVHVPSTLEGIGLVHTHEVLQHLGTAVNEEGHPGTAANEAAPTVRLLCRPTRVSAEGTWSHEEAAAGCLAVVEAAAKWCADQDAALVATELPRNPMLESFLATLYPATTERVGAVDGPLTDAATTMALPLCTSTVPHVAEVVHKAPSAWCGVSLPLSAPADATSLSTSYRHVALVQRRFTDRTTSSDGIITGPTQPCAPGPTFHIHHDAGDVRFAQRAIMESPIPAACYDDLLPLDGEVFLEVGWVEGMSFDDIDAVLNFFTRRGPHRDKAPICACATRSVYPWPVPRVAHRMPTGNVRRRTPVEDPTMEVAEREATVEMLADALHVLRWYLGTATIAQQGRGLGVVLPAERTALVSLEVPAMRMTCTWCGRERVKLLRCGGCRVACYCCKQHQQLDWKGSHKGECARWGESVKQYDAVVRPLLAQREADNQRAIPLPQTPAAAAATADADTLVAMLTRMHIRRAGGQQQHRRHVLLHVLQFEGDMDAWMACMCAATRQDRILECLGAATEATDRDTMARMQLRIVICSTTVPASHRNAVYSLSTEHGVQCVAPTGIVGDLWHEHAGGPSAGAASDAPILVRWYNEKYHQFLAKQADLLAPPPDAALVLGDAQGTGLSFFNAVSEVVAGEYAGVVPVAITDASFLASTRSVQAIVQRRDMCGGGGAGSVLTPQINAEAFGLVPTEQQVTAADPLSAGVDGIAPITGSTRATAMTTTPVVPLHRHLYYFIIPSTQGNR